MVSEGAHRHRYCEIHEPTLAEPGAISLKAARLHDGVEWLLDYLRADLQRQLKEQTGSHGVVLELIGLDCGAFVDIGPLIAKELSSSVKLSCISLASCVLDGDITYNLPEGASINLSHTRVAGDVRLYLRSADYINLEHAAISSVVEIRAREKAAIASVGALTLAHARVGELFLNNMTIAEDLDLRDCHLSGIIGAAVVRGCDARRIMASGFRAPARLALREVKTTCLDLAESKVHTLEIGYFNLHAPAGGSIMQTEPREEGDDDLATLTPESVPSQSEGIGFDLSNAEIANALSISNAVVERPFRAGAFTCQSRGPSTVEFHTCVFRDDFEFNNWSISREFRMTGVSFERAPDLSGSSLPLETALEAVSFVGVDDPGAASRYRVLRNKLDHTQATNLYPTLLALELRAKQQTRQISLVERALFMAIREIFDHGADWMGPLRTLCSAFIAFTAVYYLLDAVPALADPSANISKVLRMAEGAVRYSLQNTFLPFSTFDPQHFGTVPTVKAIIAALQSLTTLSLLASFIWALRRALHVRE